METQNTNQGQSDKSNSSYDKNSKSWEQYVEYHKRGRMFGGVLIITIGVLFLLRALHLDLPRWIFSWKMLLIGIGLVLGFKHQFRKITWIFPVLIGSAFLFVDWLPELNIRPFVWPVFIIVGGIFFMLRANDWDRGKHWRRYNRRHGRWYSGSDSETSEQYANLQSSSTSYDYNYQSNDSYYSSEDFVKTNTVMSGFKKTIISKNFKGGDIDVVMGGVELNLMQADIQDKAILKIDQVMAGTTLIIPPHWEIYTDVDTIMGSVEDKRPVYNKPNFNEIRKIIVLKGTTFMGGIDIKSY